MEVSTTSSIEDRGRPADILFPQFSYGRDLAVDITIATALQDLPACIENPLYAMSKAIRVKRNKYAGRLDGRTDFMVLALDSSGGLHPSSHTFLKRIASRLAFSLRVSREEALSRLIQKLVFSVTSEVGRGLARV
jgi:hypothetical protein